MPLSAIPRKRRAERLYRHPHPRRLFAVERNQVYRAGGEVPVGQKLHQFALREFLPEFGAGAHADAEVSREAVVQAIIEILTAMPPEKSSRTTFGVGQPGTHYDKPSFY